MNNIKFKFWNRVCAAFTLVVSALTYLLTIEPSASFWDCGEFIASSYKLEVGHPPGNPVFQLIARFFTMFTDAAHAAIAVNAMSALCSAFTIFFLYLTIVFLVKRTMKAGEDGTWTLAQAIVIFGSGIVGSLAYTFSDTFWFSAVEGEVYAMSSLFTAMVFWAMTRWYETADSPNSSRWIVLISLLMGLSIGVHLLNLLTIPTLVFLFYYRKREDGSYSFWENVKIFAISIVLLAIIFFGIVPYLPKMAAGVDRLFVNAFSLPYNSGAAFFMIALLAVCFWGAFVTLRKGKVFWNTVILCFTTIVIGFSLFSICIIRSSVKTPTNEYQPDNPYTLVRYLGREQYGSTPLLYGQYFDAAPELVPNTYWAPLDGEYKEVPGQGKLVYGSDSKMLFPRMWSGQSEQNVRFYESYMTGRDGRMRGTKVADSEHLKPTFLDNLGFFFGYQMNWMYWRYFMWNFVGRQNDLHGTNPGDPFKGNWESGIKPIDKLRLGNQDNAPDYLKNNKGKNHYFFLPLLLGLLGIFHQVSKDRRGAWITFLLFLMTGIAIVVYLNQPPYQVRERDYAYAGSFYAFAIWIGLGVAGLYAAVEELLSGRSDKAHVISAAAVSAVCLLAVPVVMGAENWDDHDRSNRRTAVEMAKNYLNSVGQNGILITHGDNDTFPLWYAQEVESIRTDVRICNTSLLGTDWHIDQMKYAVNESAPLKLSVSQRQYLYGTNEFVYIIDENKDGRPVPIKEVMANFRNPEKSRKLSNGGKVNYICSHSISIPVNRENVLRYGIVPEKYADQICDEVVLTIPSGKRYITKPELFMLDLLSNYEWDRPINMLSMGGDLNVGQKEWLMYQSFSFKFVPIKGRMSLYDPGFCDPDELYDTMMNTFTWDALKTENWFVDYQNIYTFCGVLPQRVLFLNAAKKMLSAGEPLKAVDLLDKCMESVPESNFPLDLTYYDLYNERLVIGLACAYIDAGKDVPGAKEKGIALAVRFADQITHSADFFTSYRPFKGYSMPQANQTAGLISLLASELIERGCGLEAGVILKNFVENVPECGRLVSSAVTGDIEDDPMALNLISLLFSTGQSKSAQSLCESFCEGLFTLWDSNVALTKEDVETLASYASLSTREKVRKSAEIETAKKRLSVDFGISQDIADYTEYIISSMSRFGGNTSELTKRSNSYVNAINSLVSGIGAI